MQLLKTMIFAALYIPYGFRRITGTGAFGRNRAEMVRRPASNKGTTPLKRALHQCHVKQYNDASCSVASVVSVVNALRAVNGNDHSPVGQREILEAVGTANWKQRMSRNGDRGRRGLPLSILGRVVRRSLDVYRIPVASVETVQARKNGRAALRIRETLWHRLCDFEKNGRGLIIAHFDQGVCAPTLNIPHISPVGAFDPGTGGVTILDVDPEQIFPYQISFDRFYKGLASEYLHLLRPFGYARGGYVWIQLR
jgi:Phytochelatin synthase